MQTKIKIKNIPIVISVLILLLCCSSYSSLTVYRFIEKYLPYLNLIYVFLGFAIIFKRVKLKVFILIICSICILLIVCAMNGTSAGSLATYLTCVFSLFYLEEVKITKSFCKYLAGVGKVYILLALFRSHEYYNIFISSGTVINPNTMCLVTLLFMGYINVYSKFLHIEVGLHYLQLYSIYAYLSLFQRVHGREKNRD